MIERLDFLLPTSANPTFAVPVMAQPQGVYLTTKGMSGTTGQDHIYDSYGACGDDLSQFGMGRQLNSQASSQAPRGIASNAHILRLADPSGDILSVSVDALSATQITLNCSGSLLSSGVRVIGFAISGIDGARAAIQQITGWPMNFAATWEPDFAIVNQVGARPDQTIITSTNTCTSSVGFLNPTNQMAVSTYIQLTTKHCRTLTGDARVGTWLDANGILDDHFGAFTATGVQLTSTNSLTSGVQSLACFMLKGTQSKIESALGPATQTSTQHALGFSSELLFMLAGGNTVLNTQQDYPTAYALNSRALVSPDTPPKSSAVSEREQASVNNHRSRNNAGDGQLWYDEAATTPSAPTARCRADVSAYDGTDATIDWTLDGTTGAPTRAYPYVLCALGASAGGPVIGSGAAIPFGM